MNSRYNILKCMLLCSWLGHRLDNVWGTYPGGYSIMQCTRCGFAEHHFDSVRWRDLWHGF